MTTITVESNEQGQITVSVDGGEPQPVQSAEEACQVIEQAFGGGDEENAQETAAEPGEEPGEAAFQGGFNQVRQGGLNAQGPM